MTGWKEETPTQKHLTKFEVGDWVVCTDCSAVGRDCHNPPLHKIKYVDKDGVILEGGCYIGSGCINAYRHATEEDWWFERNGVRVKAKYENDNIYFSFFYINNGLTHGISVSSGRILARSLDIPIQPAYWKPKGE